MSLNAYKWAADMPMDELSLAGHKVLLKLADVAGQDGSRAWRSTESLAHELGCSQRTVQRAISELKMKGIIRLGDQHYVDHIRPDRRPNVYDLNLDYGRDYSLPVPLHGVTTGVTPHGVTKLSRGDRSRRNGVTAGVAITGSEPTSESPIRTLALVADRDCTSKAGHRWPSKRAAEAVAIDGRVACLNGCGASASVTSVAS